MSWHELTRLQIVTVLFVLCALNFWGCTLSRCFACLHVVQDVVASMLGPNLLDALDTPQSVPTLQGGTWTALLPTRGWVAAGTLERGWNLIQPDIIWLICWGALLRHLEFHAGLRCWTGPFLWQGPPQIKTLFFNSLCIFMRASHMWFVAWLSFLGMLPVAHSNRFSHFRSIGTADGWHAQTMHAPTLSWLKKGLLCHWERWAPKGLNL